MQNTITLKKLGDASGASNRTLRRYIALGMPCAQIGRAATERGTMAKPYLFDKQAALDWIANYQAENSARQSSPFIEKLTPEDPRYEAAATATRKIEVQIQEYNEAYAPRFVIAEVTAETFDENRRHLLKIPGDLAPAIAELTGKRADKIRDAIRKEILVALEGMRVEAVFADSVPMKAAPHEPSRLDEIDADEDDGVPTAKRYATSDPRHALVTARTARVQFEIAIERGILLPVADTLAAQDMILGTVASQLRALGGSIAQRMAPDRADVSRAVKDMIDRAVNETYSRINAVTELDADDDMGEEL